MRVHFHVLSQYWPCVGLISFAYEEKKVKTPASGQNSVMLKKATPKVKHHKFFAQRHVEVQFIPRPYALRVMAKL